MKIRTTNLDKIEAELLKVEKGCRERLFDINKIGPAIESAMKQLYGLGVPKKHWVGCKIEFQPEKVCNSYNYIANGTYIVVERFPSGWFVTDIERASVGRRSNGDCCREDLYLSDTAINSIPRRWQL